MASRVFSSRIAAQLAALNNRGRRSYAAAAASVVRQESSSAGAARLQAAAAEAPNKEGFFWMRDPKTGNWMPENHFHDVDAAELRARLLFSKKN